MLKITKGNVKPVFFEMRKKYDDNFDNMYADDKNALKEILIAEQRSRCAYCMCRIEMSNSTIEHYIPRSVDMNLSIDYRNLFAMKCSDEEINIYTPKKSETQYFVFIKNNQRY